MMESDLNHNAVSSRYSPLNSPGPLPPGLTSRVVKEAYRAANIRPTVVLALAKVPQRLGSPNSALRQKLDLPDFRERLSELAYKGRALAFHQVLFDLARSSHAGKGISRRLIEPATYLNEKGLLFLNPIRFSQLIATEMRDIFGQIEEVQPRTAEEALVHFVLAFGLLQPRDALAIVTPLLTMGDGIATYFGITIDASLAERNEVKDATECDQLGAQPPQSQKVTLLSTQTSSPTQSGTRSPKELEEFKTISTDAEAACAEDAGEQRKINEDTRASSEADTCITHRNDLAKSTLTEGSLRTEEVSVVHSVTGQDSVADATCQDSESQGEESTSDLTTSQVGKWQAQYYEAYGNLETWMKARMSLGSANRLDLPPFLAAAKREEAAIQHLGALERELLFEAEARPRQFASLAGSHIRDIRFDSAPEEDCRAIAAWLDDWDLQVPAVEEKLKELDRKQSLLCSLLPKRNIAVKQAGVRASWADILDLMNQRAKEFDTAIDEVLDWQNELRRLQDELQDCVKPLRSSSLLQVSRNAVPALIHLTKYNQNFEPLQPLLFRLLGELECEGENKYPGRMAQLLEESLSLAARIGDDELLQETVAFVQPSMIQELLRNGSHKLARYLILCTFRDSVARQRPLFFNEIWSCSGWFERQACVGASLTRAFDALNRLYIQRGSVHAVISVLEAPEARTDMGGIVESARRQEAEDLATRLENPSNMPGLFGRTRKLAALHFKPIAMNIRRRLFDIVNEETLRLEQQYSNGALEAAIMQQLDERYVRTEHTESLRRFLETQLGLVRKWVEEEQRISQATNDLRRGDVEEESRGALRNFVDDSGQKEAQSEVGSVEWLCEEIREVIRGIRKGEVPETAFAFFGSLPPIQSLFPSYEMLEHGADSINAKGKVVAQTTHTAVSGGENLTYWHIGMERSPKNGRLWLCYLDGQYSWEDLLQDGVAELIVLHPPDLLDVLQSFLDCGRPDALLEAIRIPGFLEVPGIGELARAATELNLKKEHLNQQISKLTHQMGVIQSVGFRSSVSSEIDDLELHLLEATDALERCQLDEAEKLVQDIKLHMDGIERQTLEDDQERMEVYGWLKEAGEEFDSRVSLEQLQKRVLDVRDRNRARMGHLLQLKQLDADDIPTRLRKEVRTIMRELDHPAKWPTEAAANDAQFYLELLTDICRDWCVTREHREYTELHFRLVDQIIDLFCARLSIELGAILDNQSHDAPMLTSLLEPGSNKSHTYYKLLIGKGLLQEDFPIAPAAPDQHQTEHSSGTPSLIDDVYRRLHGLIEIQSISEGSGETVGKAFDAFADERYQDALTLAASAWRWAQHNNAEKRLSSLCAVFAWSYFEVFGPAYELAFRDSIGLLFKNFEEVRSRCHMEEGKLIKWWLDGPNKRYETDSESNLAQRIADHLEAMSKAGPGNAKREEFGSILRIAGASIVVRMLWNALRGQDLLTYRGRTAQLVLLFSLGEFEALSTLFEQAGDNKKYLNAFLGLVAQAMANPSPKLVTAIRQNWMTLQTRKVPRPFQEFARQLMARIQLDQPQIEVDISEVLEPHPERKFYRMLVALRPDESDPPLSLRMELLDDGDFVLADPKVRPIVISDENLLLSPTERELVVRPKDRSSAGYVVLRLKGETASGCPIDNTVRREVRLGQDGEWFKSMDKDTLLEIYEGYRGEPVCGGAFIGRERELESLERAVDCENPGAALIYGARRLGKTSLLDELRRRRCITNRSGSQSLFLVIPVDTFEVRSGTKSFADQFFRLITNSVNADPKNAEFRIFLERLGVDSRRLREASHLDDSLQDAPFLIKTREYLRSLKELANNRFSRAILVMDEFDKLLENYRKGYVNEVEELVSQLRRAATEESDIGVVVAGSDLMRRITGHYRSALYGSAIEIELGYFEGEIHKTEAREIIAPKGIRDLRDFPPQVIQEIVRVTGGHPLYMRLIGCVTSYISTRQRISIGTVMEATRRFLANDVLQGDLPGPMQLILQPLQALRLMETALDENLGRLLLLQLAKHTSLERPWTQWAVISQDESLLALRSNSVWMRIRNSLRDSGLLAVDERFLWSIRLPILAEALRRNWEVEYGRLYSEIEAQIQEG